MLKKTLTIQNKLGLHARAAAKFVATASRYRSEIFIQRNERQVNGKSIMGVMMLAASYNTKIDLSVEGEDQEAAFKALSELINNKFGEAE